MAKLTGARAHVSPVRRMVDEIDRPSTAHELRVLARDRAVVHHEIVACGSSHRQAVLAGWELHGGASKEHGQPRLLAETRTREQERGFLELPHRFVELDFVLFAAQ